MLLRKFITVTDRRDKFVTVLTLSSPTYGRQHDNATTPIDLAEQHRYGTY